ncbi:hypothetical protein ACFE04_028103 [Oxalis oulophora]
MEKEEAQKNIPKYSCQPNKATDNNNKTTRAEKDSSSCVVGRDRLKRHREEVAAGNVLIPDTWGKEGLLKDWVDYSSFDVLLNPSGLSSARKALVPQSICILISQPTLPPPADQSPSPIPATPEHVHQPPQPEDKEDIVIEPTETTTKWHSHVNLFS